MDGEGAASAASLTGRGCRVASVGRRAFWKLLFQVKMGQKMQSLEPLMKSCCSLIAWAQCLRVAFI